MGWNDVRCGRDERNEKFIRLLTFTRLLWVGEKDFHELYRNFKSSVKWSNRSSMLIFVAVVGGYCSTLVENKKQVIMRKLIKWEFCIVFKIAVGIILNNFNATTVSLKWMPDVRIGSSSMQHIFYFSHAQEEWKIKSINIILSHIYLSFGFYSIFSRFSIFLPFLSIGVSTHWQLPYRKT